VRRIDPRNFRVATRGTTREINRSIVLNLIRTQQPISRADLARIMGTRRGAVSLLVNELLADGTVFEGAKGEAGAGASPSSCTSTRASAAWSRWTSAPRGPT
jgi:hypothetical protein